MRIFKFGFQYFSAKTREGKIPNWLEVFFFGVYSFPETTKMKNVGWKQVLPNQL